MRLATIIFLVLLTKLSNGQEIDSLGIDNNPILNGYEVKYFNDILEERRDTFNFKNKKISFVTGSSGTMIVSKEDYFTRLVKPWLIKGSKPQTFFVALNKEEKEISGGYDAIVLTWVKLFTDKRKKKIIKQLGRHE
jgi:hypothetical protein